MNTIKLLSPDFAFGKALVKGKSILQAITFLARRPNPDSLEIIRLILKVKPNYTMVRNRNLITLYESIQTINNEDLPGDIVECGVWNGGSAAVMGVSCFSGVSPHNRKMWLFDSFQGLPPTSERDNMKERRYYFDGLNKGNIENVKAIFNQLRIPMNNVNIVEGWFQSTLRTAPINNIALLHIDADWYESVKFVLDTLYNKVITRGYIVFDDYFYWQGCKDAVHDFLSEHNLDKSLIQGIDRDGAYFRKPPEGDQ